MKPIDAAGYPSLVIFWDSSEEAYGVVAYIRWKLSGRGYVSRLVASKCKISVVRLDALENFYL